LLVHQCLALERAVLLLLDFELWVAPSAYERKFAEIKQLM